MYDISSIDDFAAIISSALADTTVPSQGDERADSRDSWMDIDAWIAASVPDKPLAQELADFGLPASPPADFRAPDCYKGQQELLQRALPGSALQSLLTHGYVPRLARAAPEAPSSTSAADAAYAPHKPRRSRAKPRAPALAYAPELAPLLGKDKPVHRCGICNRGFLNKSNIKVHLRTHTGEKPFRCDVCSKAFRQKAHLIKHQQIHKRLGRD